MNDLEELEQEVKKAKEARQECHKDLMQTLEEFRKYVETQELSLFAEEKAPEG